MSGRKLISFMVKSKNQNHIIVTLFKKNIQYLVRTEYMHRDDKVKETNQEIDRNLVYRIFCALELTKFDEIVNVDNAEKVANIKIYYGDQEYLEFSISKDLLKKEKGLNDVIECLINYIDDSLNREIFV